MARKLDIIKALEKLDRAQDMLIKKRVEAIRKMNIEADEKLRNHMLTLDGFRNDIVNLITQLNSYINKNKILVSPAPKSKAVGKAIGKKRGKTALKKGRAPVGKIAGKKKGITPLEKTAKKQSVKGRSKPLPPVGTKLIGRFKGKEYWGDVTEKGITIEGFEGTFATMSAAAAAVTGRKTLNGWAFWKQIKMETD